MLGELTEAGARRDDLVLAFGGGVVGDLAGLLRRHLPAGGAAGAGADDPGRPGGLRLRRQDRRGPGPRPRTTSAPTTMPIAVLTDPGDARHPAPGGAGGGLRRGAEDGAARRRRALGAGAGDRLGSTRCSWAMSSSTAPGRRSRSSPPTSATPGAARSSTSATPSATRSRPRPATGATATARPSASACSPPCGSRTPTSFGPRSRRCSRPTGCRSRSTPPSRLDCRAGRDRPRQEGDRRGSRLRAALRAGRAPVGAERSIR